ncbi:myosin heavy chain [Senna tora]|uniref:Myosin heavy chain n=1 Tax=Senna tora TaxID=362788 RepID=A0A834W4H7_9FABA|nr:myosin heavy chain [Senna tora]
MKVCEGNELECELERWKSACERMKKDLEESHVRRKELEASLLGQVEFGESLRQETNKHEKDKFIQLMNKRKMTMDEIMHHMASLQEQFSNSLTSFSSQLEDDDQDTEAEEQKLS